MKLADLRSFASLLLVGASLWGCGGDPAPDRPRNVILFVVDTLRADRLGAYGYPRPTTPTIDRFALSGTVYERNRSQAPWTVPSMISMMTGLYVTDEEQVLPPNVPTLAERVQDTGRTTAAFVGNMVLTTDRGFERGFDHFEYISATRARRVVDRFVQWHRAAESRLDDGFFAWLHPLDPHTPYDPKPGDDVFDGPRPEQAELERRWARDMPRVEELAGPSTPLPLEGAIDYIEEKSNLYDGEVWAVDQAFARLLKYLRETGLYEETTIVFAADHGELLWEYPKYPQELQARIDRENGLPLGIADLYAFGHRAWYFPELWNTPLIIAGPGFPSGQRRTGLSGNLDIFPTLMSLLEADWEADTPGVDLSGGADPTRERIFAHGFETSAVLERDGEQLVEYAPIRFQLPADAPSPRELFDLNTGPELVDLGDDRPETRERMAEELRAWRQQHARELTIEVIGEEAEAALRALGYLED